LNPQSQQKNLLAHRAEQVFQTFLIVAALRRVFFCTQCLEHAVWKITAIRLAR
jgi:hypothetical protein